MRTAPRDLWVLCTVALVALFFGPAAAAAPEAPGWPSKEEFRQVIEMMASSDSAPLKTDLRAVYSAVHAPRNVTKAQLRRALRSFSQSLALEPSGSSVRVVGDPYYLPNLEAAQLRFRWKVATAGSRRSLLERSRRNKAAPFAPLFASFSSKLTNQRVDQMALTREPKDPSRLLARGEVTARVAGRFERFDFACAKGGRATAPKALKRAGISVALKQCERDVVELQTTGIAKQMPIVILVRDDSGGRLKSRQSGRQPVFAPGKSFGSLDYDGLAKNVPFKQFVADYLARNAIATAHRAHFHGIVQTVEVWVARNWIDARHGVVAGTCPKQAKRYPARCARYLPPGQTPRFRKLAAREVEAQTRAVPTRDPSALGGGKPELTLLLPRWPQSPFAKVQIPEPKIYDGAGKGLEAEISESGFVADEDRVTTYIEPNSTDKLARIAGSFDVIYPLEVLSVRLTPKQPSASGLTAHFSGDHRVRIEVGPGVLERLLPERSFAFSRPAWHSIRGYDDKGRLVRLDRQDLGSPSTPTISLRFSGRVSAVEVLQVARWHRFTVEYDGKAAPPIAENRRGDSAARYTARRAE